jgi:putative ATPase
MSGDLFDGLEDDDASSRKTKEDTPFRQVEERQIDPRDRPLADRLRPQLLGDLLGQDDLLGANGPLGRLIRADRVPSMILWGPPGCGKTTLAGVIARETDSDFVTLSAVTSSVKDVRAVIDMAKTNRRFNRRTILFVDEIHRFNRAQQDAFLPHVESGIITLIGATTENPSFSVIAPLLSRCRVFVLRALAEGTVTALLRRGLEVLAADQRGVAATDDALTAIASLCDGDARRALGLLEVAADVQRSKDAAAPLSAETVLETAQRHLVYDKSGEEHFNLISALHKTLRSGDPHAALYWLGRMIAGGEDPLYVARRMVRFASEDIGNADPRALQVAMESMRAYQMLGSPEGDLALAQCCLYLALAPKSNAVYRAWKNVTAEIAASGSLPVPLHLRNAPTGLMKDLGYGGGYTYDPEAEGGFSAKQGLPDALHGRTYYEPAASGWEGTMRDGLAARDEARRNVKPGGA